MEEIKDMNNLMSANDWRDRYKGITTLLEMCEINSNLVSHNIVKVGPPLYLRCIVQPNFKYVSLFCCASVASVNPIILRLHLTWSVSKRLACILETLFGDTNILKISNIVGND